MCFTHGLERNSLGAIFTYGLVRSWATDLKLCVLEGNPFPPCLAHGLEASLLLIFTMPLTLLTLSSFSFSLMTCMPCTLMVLKEANLFLCCSFLPHAFFTVCVSLAGVLKRVLVHVHLAVILKELDEWF